MVVVRLAIMELLQNWMLMAMCNGQKLLQAPEMIDFMDV